VPKAGTGRDTGWLRSFEPLLPDPRRCAIFRKLVRRSFRARREAIRSEAKQPHNAHTARVSAIMPGFVIPYKRKRHIKCISQAKRFQY
jgi:hypothetical protein